MPPGRVLYMGNGCTDDLESGGGFCVMGFLRRAWCWIDFIGRILLAIPLVALIVFLTLLCELEERVRG